MGSRGQGAGVKALLPLAGRQAGRAFWRLQRGGGGLSPSARPPLLARLSKADGLLDPVLASCPGEGCPGLCQWAAAFLFSRLLVPPGKKAQPGRMGPESTAEEAPALRLQATYAHLCEAVERLRGRRGQLQAQQEFLQQEFGELQAESLAFLGQLSRRAQGRQGAVVSLSEQNRRALEELREEQRRRWAHHQEQEESLRKQLLTQRAELDRLGSELEGLRWVRALRERQAARLQGLQQELATARREHARRLREARARFLQGKAAQERAAQERAGRLAPRVEAAAARCLLEQRPGVQQESRELWRELRRLVGRAQQLRARKGQLQRRLRRQQSCLRGLALLREQFGSRPAPRKEGAGQHRQSSFLATKGPPGPGW
uniref:DUF4515 domain-containing protein n=1 Tax=Salvator merianae TaxID=96440 RepID=A0A8D0DSE3_SALMN